MAASEVLTDQRQRELERDAGERIREQIAAKADDIVRDSIWALMGRRYTVTELAKAAGMNAETLRRKLNAVGSERALTVGELARIALVFGTSPDALFNGLGGHVLRASEDPVDRLRERVRAKRESLAGAASGADSTPR